MKEKTSFPFNMIEKMMPMYPAIALMAWMFVLIAFLIGLFVFAPAATTFLSDTKAVREGASAGSLFVQANVTSHVIETWVPQFKFFGLGLALMAITMALVMIARQLQRMGQVIVEHIPPKLRPQMPKPPKTVRLFQLSTIMGIMILLVVLIIGVVLAAGVIPSYWNHSIASELNPAQPGSVILSQFSVLKSYAAWLNPLRMVGMTFLFSAITLALTVILKILRTQFNMLTMLYRKVSVLRNYHKFWVHLRHKKLYFAVEIPSTDRYKICHP